MANVRPFQGLRFSSAAGPIQDLVAPPYDVLSQADRDALAEKNPHNIVHLTLPEAKPDDRSKYVKYARSAADLAEWRREGVLQLEPQPAFYRYTQTFTIPGSPDPYTRTSLVTLLKVELYEKGIVLPHEQTFPKHKEDRLRLLEATRAHVECIYGLFEDPGGAVFTAISSAPAGERIELATEDCSSQVLEPIVDPETTAKLQAMIADKKVWIADGHHRYETALNFRAAAGDKPGICAEDFMMMALGSMSDPGLVLLPTHRIVKEMPVSAEELERRLREHFEVSKMPNDELIKAMEDQACGDTRVFGFALPGGIGLLAKIDDVRSLLPSIDCEGSDRLKLLDVTILHELIFGKLLGLHGLDFFSYTRDPEEALAAAQAGNGAAFLMNPPTVEDMRQIALGGEKMPQKSTYYYPKLLSGLVVWSLNDFQP